MPKGKNTCPKFSSQISDVLKLMDDAKNDYVWNYEEVNRMEKLIQDYLHKLELDGLDYGERAKVATQLTKCCQLRRESKDMVEVLSPLIQYLDSDRGKNLINMMREVLGKTRKVEEKMAHRTYHPRVLGKEPKNNSKNN